MAKGKKTGGRNFQPGVVTNPLGRPKLADDIKITRALTKVEFTLLSTMHLNMSEDQLDEILADSTTPMINKMVAQVIKKAAIEGDQHRLNFLLERLIGKVPTPIQASIDPSVLEIYESLKDKSEDELLAIVNKSRLESR